MGKLTVSVVVPLYNHEKYIADALASIVRQTYPASEIIVIDDGSTDRSLEAAQSFVRQAPFVDLSTQPNQGAHQTINTGIQQTCGDVVAILNSDDLYHEQRLERSVLVLEQNPEIDAVASHVSFTGGGGVEPVRVWYEEGLNTYRQSGDLALALSHRNFLLSTSNIIARRSLFDDIGFFAKLRYAHDLDFFLRIIARSRRIAILETPLLTYRIHDSNSIARGDVGDIDIERAAAIGMYFYTSVNGREMLANQSYIDVLRRLRLTNPVLLFVDYFHRSDLRSLEYARWENDRSFLIALRASFESSKH